MRGADGWFNMQRLMRDALKMFGALGLGIDGGWCEYLKMLRNLPSNTLNYWC